MREYRERSASSGGRPEQSAIDFVTVPVDADVDPQRLAFDIEVRGGKGWREQQSNGKVFYQRHELRPYL